MSVDELMKCEEVSCKKEDRPFLRLFPKELIPLVNSFRFKLMPDEVREIAWQVTRGKEEWDRRFPANYNQSFDTMTREECEETGVIHFIRAFSFLAWGVKYTPKIIKTFGLTEVKTAQEHWCVQKIVRTLMLIRLWDEQTGSGLVTSDRYLGLDVAKLRQESKFFDDLFTDIKKRHDVYRHSRTPKKVELVLDSANSTISLKSQEA